MLKTMIQRSLKICTRKRRAKFEQSDVVVSEMLKKRKRQKLEDVSRKRRAKFGQSMQDVAVSEMLKTRKRQKLEDVFAIFPIELIHIIQSLLPVKESARTSILSKSFLHAWSTIPTLRFPLLMELPDDLEVEFLEKEEDEEEVKRQREYNKFIENTLLRYHRDNIPIQRFDLQFYINNKGSASVFGKLIAFSCSSFNTCLKELYLKLWVVIDLFTFPDEIFSCQNLDKIFLRSPDCLMDLWINPPPHMIKCVSLRILHLKHISFNDEVFDSIMSTCILLEEIILLWCYKYKTLKVKNLPCLRKLKIRSISYDDVLEMSNLPSLDDFKYSSIIHTDKRILPFNMDSLGSVKYMLISGVIMNIAFFDMIKNKLPFLESLYIGFGSFVEPWESLVIASRSIKHLTIHMLVDTPVIVQVDAPNLLSVICYCSDHAAPPPILSFLTIAPGQVKVTID